MGGISCFRVGAAVLGVGWGLAVFGVGRLFWWWGGGGCFGGPIRPGTAAVTAAHCTWKVFFHLAVPLSFIASANLL